MGKEHNPPPFAQGVYDQGILERNAHGDRISVDVQADIVHDFFHGCLLSIKCYQCMKRITSKRRVAIMAGLQEALDFFEGKGVTSGGLYWSLGVRS